MSKYTTGEMASLCGVTVRTVQYYDSRGILVPSELSEGGRRLYNENDLKKLRVICFLRDMDFKIDIISKIFEEDNSANVIGLLVEQQKAELKGEISDKKEQLEKLEALSRELKGNHNFSVESIGDIAYTMNNKEKLKKIHRNMIISAIPIGILEWSGILLWIFKGWWWLFVIYLIAAIPYAIIVSKYYFKNVDYICPECHTVFKPRFKEAFWAKHTPKARKLRCPECNHKGYCIEVAAEDKT